MPHLTMGHEFHSVEYSIYGSLAVLALLVPPAIIFVSNLQIRAPKPEESKHLQINDKDLEVEKEERWLWPLIHR